FYQTVVNQRTDAYLRSTYATPAGFTPFTSVREFTAATSVPGGKAIFSCRVKGLDGTVGGLVLAKLMNNGTRRAFTFAASGDASSASGTWWMLDSAGSPMTGAQTLDTAVIYEFRFIIQDNDSRFDLDPTSGTIRDPFVLGTGGDWRTPKEDDGGSGGGGGCYFNPLARFGLEWLLFLAIPALVRLHRPGRRAN
ncbi:MAG: WD40 repeat domain-containing protein, partial [Desulfocurvibacter africanus]